MGELPRINWLVDVELSAGVSFRSRIEDRDGDLLTITAPMGPGDVVQIPEENAVLELAWIAGRARYGVPARLLGLTREWPPRWFVMALGAPALKNRRRFVRGGGGEPVTIHTVDRDPPAVLDGRVIDLSEGGARCRVPGTDLAEGEPVTICVVLPDATVQVEGVVLALRRPDDPGSRDVDVVVTYDPPESIARMLRRYVLAWELAERNGAHNSATRPPLTSAEPARTASPAPAVPNADRVAAHAFHQDGVRHPSTLTSRPRATARPATGTTPPNRYH